MPEEGKKLVQFWQEVRRRKVVRVISVYAAAAFVILELVDIIAGPLNLPEWFLTAVIVILCIGFVIAAIVSWIFDIHPEGGVVRTDPLEQVDEEPRLKSSNIWKISSYISFVVIIALILLNVFRGSEPGESSELGNAIAVLPFRNDSPDEEKMYFINGTMESILDNLCRIEALRVPGRTSVEQYRNTTKTISNIAEELNVDYLLEGSGQKLGNRIQLTVQLIDGVNDRHIWSRQYNREIRKVEDLLDIQSEIAKLVAGEIKVLISPEELQLIESVPTTSLTAYDFYQQGNEQYRNFSTTGDTIALDRAEKLFFKALENDSGFAKAYVGLAWTYWEKIGNEQNLSKNYLDTVQTMAEIALSLDPNLFEAHLLNGYYYRAMNEMDLAFKHINKTLELNPSNWSAYWALANLYSGIDAVQRLDNLHKAAALAHGSRFPMLLRIISNLYYGNGFFDQGARYGEQYMDLTGDSVFYYRTRAAKLDWNDPRRIDLHKRIYDMDTSHRANAFTLMERYSQMGFQDEAMVYLNKYLLAGGTYDLVRIGFIYWQNGYHDEARIWLDKAIEKNEQELDLGMISIRTYMPYYKLAQAYAIQGKKIEALEYFRHFSQREGINYILMQYIRHEPSLNELRNEEEFQQLLAVLESKYKAEHERIRQWLEENDRL